MSVCVIDTSALLAYLNGETGEDQVADWLEQGAAASALIVQELVSRVLQGGGTREDAAATVFDLGLDIHDLTVPLAIEAGAMITATRANGLSHGDRACLALARALDLPAVTADRVGADLSAKLGVEIRLVR